MSGKFRFHSTRKHFPHTHYSDPDAIKSDKKPGKQKLSSNRALLRRGAKLIDTAIKKLVYLEDKFKSSTTSPYVAKNQFKKLHEAKNDLAMATATLQDVSVKPVKKTIAKLQKIQSDLGAVIPVTKASPFLGGKKINTSKRVKKEVVTPLLKKTIKRLEKSSASLLKKADKVSEEMQQLKRVFRDKTLEEEDYGEVDETPEPVAPHFMDDFFKTAKERGWTVNDDVKKKYKKPVTKVVRSFDEGMAVIQNASMPKENLLTEDVPIGLLEFPILLVQKRRLTESIIKDIFISFGYLNIS